MEVAIDAAQSEICFYIYNASAEHLLDLFHRAKARDVQIQLMHDVNVAQRFMSAAFVPGSLEVLHPADLV